MHLYGVRFESRAIHVDRVRMERSAENVDGVRMERSAKNVGGVRMHAFVSTNDAPAENVPLVLIHGLGVSGTYWLPTAALLGEHFHVLVPDLPGFGDSDKPHHVLDLRELADVLVAWMDEMGVDRATLVGNSMGCQIAVHVAVAHPDRVTRLVLQAPTIDPGARSAARQIGRLIVDGLVEPPSLLPIVTRDYLKCGYRRIARTLRHSLEDPIEEKLPQVHAPALVVRGARDVIVPQYWAEEAARLLPIGRLVVVPGAAHAMNFALPMELTRIILDFLTADNRGAPG